MRLNLGCGGKKLAGWINVDKFETAATDLIFDMEVFPWPSPDDSVDEVLMAHVLEHLGAQTSVYLGIIKELYRVCRDGAKIKIAVPHPRHDNFLSDPTHARYRSGKHQLVLAGREPRVDGHGRRQYAAWSLHRRRL